MGIHTRDHINSKKKIKATTRTFNTALFLLRCAELNLSPEMLEILTVGDVLDLLAEKANDAEKYPEIATQEDISAFFG